MNSVPYKEKLLRRVSPRPTQPNLVKELDMQGHKAIINMLARYPLGVVDETGPVPETRF